MHNIRYNCRLLCRGIFIKNTQIIRYYCDETVKKLNLLFFGTDKFSLPSLVTLNEARKCSGSKINQVDVVTSFNGKENPVFKYANESNLKCFDWKTFVTDDLNYDAGVVVSFGHLIPEKMIKMFPLGMINVHASLLPRWRGASPIIHAILNEDDVTGVSIMRIRPHKFDTGEIFAQKEIPIPKNVLMSDLHETLSHEGAELLVKFLQEIPKSLELAKEQSDSNISYAPRVLDSMANIDWQTMTAHYISNLYRSLYSFKWLEMHWHKRRVKIKELLISDAPVDEVIQPKRPGFIEYDKKHKYFRVHCVDGHCIYIKRLKIEGKREMTAAEFNSGFIKKVDPCDRFFS